MNESLSSAMAGVLRSEKAKRKLTIRELVARTGMDKSTIDRHLNERSEIVVPQLELWADAFGLSATELMELAEKEAGKRPSELSGEHLEYPSR